MQQIYAEFDIILVINYIQILMLLTLLILNLLNSSFPFKQTDYI